MDSLKSILAATDFSACADSAVEHAFRLARGHDSEVIVLHVVQPLLYNRDWLGAEAAALVPTTGQLMDQARERMRSAFAPRAASCRVRYEVVAGHALGTILDWSERARPDLLVLGTHSTLDAHRHMGYVASGAVRKAAPPVLAVHPSGAGPFRSVLVPTDFSDTSALALRCALRIATLDNSQVEILHTYPEPWKGSQPPEWIRETVPDLSERYARRVREHTEAWAGPIISENPGVTASITVTQHPKPGAAIVEHARLRGVDLIAMGVSGATNLRAMLLGSTAERVLREVPCSVLAVKPESWHGHPR
ncbi:MAG: universal stress protein [Phycisphaerales bacterium]